MHVHWTVASRDDVPTALSELRPILGLFRCKIFKLNTLSVTKHYAELSAGKCTVFQSLRMWNIRINVKICIKISFCISRPFQPAPLLLNWHGDRRLVCSQRSRKVEEFRFKTFLQPIQIHRGPVSEVTDSLTSNKRRCSNELYTMSK